MKVLKFGGTSVGSTERINQVLNIIIEEATVDKGIAVVFSAFDGITDQLIRMGHLASEGKDDYKNLFDKLEERHVQTASQLISIKHRSGVLTQLKIMLKNLEEVLFGVFLVKELTLKTLDYLMSFGELLSAFTISESLKDRGTENRFIDSRELIVTDQNFGKARVNFTQTYKNIRSVLNKPEKVYVITGFIGRTPENETTTLGRGGSDFSASIFGVGLGASEIVIWTDVDGVLTADPRKVPNAFSINQLTYEEAMELSHFGAKVIHPPTMQPALKKNIPIKIKNTFNPSFKGTLIENKREQSDYIITGLSSIDAVALLQIQGSGMVGATGIAERILNALAKEDINIILISQASSEHSICLGILPQSAKKAKSALEKELKYELHYGQVNEISIESDMAIIAVVGENMRKTKGIAGRIFQTLGNNGVNISAIAQGSSELNISIVIDRLDVKRALNAIHNAFFKTEEKVLNLFIVGTGLIGKTLLDQLKKQGQFLKDDASLSVRLIGLGNIDKMLIDMEGLPITSCYQDLQKSKKDFNAESFIDSVKTSDLANCVFIDCTASDKIADRYQEVLNAAVSIVTPNKIANTQSYEKYQNLRKAASKNNVKFLYETNVGAGLPVINTIKNMVSAGDRIHKIEGILSGTLSYIFNSFDGKKQFSQVVQEAKEKGYTEPDPRIDLSGLDVARKLLILIREIGYRFELADIRLESLLPEEAREAHSVQEFFNVLKKYDNDFELMWQEAKEEENVLRHIARFENNQAEVLLTAVDTSHPFFSLSESDNIIAIYSDSYRNSPLVIKGPGAGADVTASGVLADILQCSSYAG